MPKVENSTRFTFLPRDATQSAVMRLHVVCLSVFGVSKTPKTTKLSERKNKQAVLLQREPHNGAKNLDMYRILQRHRRPRGGFPPTAWLF